MNQSKKKRKYYRICGECGHRFEQSDMIRTKDSDTGWLCKDCYAKVEDAADFAFHPEWIEDEY